MHEATSISPRFVRGSAEWLRIERALFAEGTRPKSRRASLLDLLEQELRGNQERKDNIVA
jgi:hypothetical protein